MATRGINGRNLTTMTLAVSSLVLAASGAVLFTAPRGWFARSADWSFVWIGREQWGALHAVMALTVLIAASIHVWYNWKPLMHYLKDRVKAHVRPRWEPFIALAMVAAIAGCTLMGWPPFRAVGDLHDWARGQWEANAPDENVGADSGLTRGGGFGRRRQSE